MDTSPSSSGGCGAPECRGLWRVVDRAVVAAKPQHSNVPTGRGLRIGDFRSGSGLVCCVRKNRSSKPVRGSDKPRF